MHRRMMLRGLAAGVFLISGCATHRDEQGQQTSHLDPKYFFKSDIDRVVDTSRSQILEGLLRIADKLYRRNPKEWRRGGFSSREAALDYLRAFRANPPVGLEGRREGAAALQAFSPGFNGDRVGALLYGLLTMVDAAYEYKDESFILDSLNEQKFYNCARNMEIALWKLSNARDSKGALLLLSNEISETGRNLSFEREFGHVIGLLDFMSKILEDKSGRLVTRIAQTVATSFFLPVGGL